MADGRGIRSRVLPGTSGRGVFEGCVLPAAPHSLRRVVLVCARDPLHCVVLYHVQVYV